VEVADLHAAEGRSIDEILASITGGRDVGSDIFETLKSVAKAPGGAEETLASRARATATTAVPPEPEAAFVCPVCNTSVEGDATACPGCGAQFVEGEAAEFECPVCKSAVAEDADRCPSCGVQFAGDEEAESPPRPEPEVAPPARAPPVPPVTPSEAAFRSDLRTRLQATQRARREAPVEPPSGDRKLMYRELPRLVNEVKARLVSAKKLGIPIEDEKRLINDAIAAGKRRDIERAVGLIDEAKHALDIAFTDFIGGRIQSFLGEVSKAGTRRGPEFERALEEAVERLEGGDYDAAWEGFEDASAGFQTQAKGYHEARDALARDERVLAEVRALGMDTKEIEQHLKPGRDALGRQDTNGALRNAKAAHEAVLRLVPAFVNEEMRKARNTLLDLKMRGGDLSKPIGILKAASVHAKKEEWSDALRYIKEFHKEVGGR